MAILHYFNPGHETAIRVDSPHYMPPKNIQTMIHDLSLLPQWYGEKDDYVFVESDIKGTRNNIVYGLELPQIINKKALISQKTAELKLNPWGLTLPALHYFQQLNDEGANIALPSWQSKIKTFTHRRFAAYCLRLLSDVFPVQPPFFCSTLNDVKAYMQKQPPPYILKAPYSSSGRGIRIIRNNRLDTSDILIINGILNKQKEISIEPLLDKKCDFALEFYLNGKGQLSFEGFSLFSTDNSGNFSGNYIGDQRNLINQHLLPYVSLELINQTVIEITKVLEHELSNIYKGYLGVDMIIYKNEFAKYTIHPCIEINMRYTMGLLAYQLYNKHIYNKSKGVFKIDFFKAKDEALAFYYKYEKEHPIQTIDNKIKKGFLSLCPIGNNTQYVAYIIIEENSLQET